MRITPAIAAHQNALRRLARPVPVLYFDPAGEERDGNLVAVRGGRGCLVIDLVTGDSVWRSPLELVDEE
jgi:hypothetical protein